MSYLFPPIAFVSRPTPPKFTPKVHIADGIRRGVEDGSLEPATRFVTEADYLLMMKASEDVAVALADHIYKVGRREGKMVVLVPLFLLLLLLALSLQF